MKIDVAERLEFVKTQLRSAERAFMGGGHIQATHDVLDKFQIAFSSHPSVLKSVRETRTAISTFLTSKINDRLAGEDNNHHPVTVWHCFNRMEQAIHLVSVGHGRQAVSHSARLTVAA